MREARIILPTHDNNRNPLTKVHRELAKELLKSFGGYTKCATHGGYINGHGVPVEERGYAYDVAMEDTLFNRDALYEMAQDYGTIAKQESVYLRYPDGSVDFVPCLSVADAYKSVSAEMNAFMGVQ